MSSDTIHTMHVGLSSWPAHPLEDSCPCPKVPCGLVSTDDTDPGCGQHSGTKKALEVHQASDCQHRIDGTGPYTPRPAR